jgi:hypothetical protein
MLEYQIIIKDRKSYALPVLSLLFLLAVLSEIWD